MANVLTSFLVGIGFDTTGIDKGVREVESGIGSVRTTALKTSAALVGAFGAAAASVVNTANQIDQVALAANNLRTSQQYIYNFGNALKTMGGNAGDALDTVKNIEGILNAVPVQGTLGPLEDVARAGVDISRLTYANSAEDFFADLASQLPNLSTQQRGVVQESLGLSDAALKALVSGPAAFEAALARAESLTGHVEDLTENSRRLAEEAAEFALTIEGVRNELAEKFLPSLIGASTWINDFLEKNRGAISTGVDFVSENPGATTALGASAGAAVSGAALSKLGLGTIGGALGKAGTAGVIASGAALSARATSNLLSLIPSYNTLSAGFDAMLRDTLGVERIVGPLEFFGGSLFSASDSMPPSTTADSITAERQANADAIAGALKRSPIESNINMTVQLDGQALETKIIQTTEQAAFNTMNDITTTTER